MERWLSCVRRIGVLALWCAPVIRKGQPPGTGQWPRSSRLRRGQRPAPAAATIFLPRAQGRAPRTKPFKLGVSIAVRVDNYDSKVPRIRLIDYGDRRLCRRLGASRESRIPSAKSGLAQAPALKKKRLPFKQRNRWNNAATSPEKAQSPKTLRYNSLCFLHPWVKIPRRSRRYVPCPCIRTKRKVGHYAPPKHSARMDPFGGWRPHFSVPAVETSPAKLCVVPGGRFI
jgi:hypothetical protein